MKFISSGNVTATSDGEHAHLEEASSSTTITREIITDRSWTATFTWYLFRALVPFFLPAPIYIKGPQEFPLFPPIPASCLTQTWEYNSWTMTSIISRQKPRDSPTSRAMIYLHGGAFNHPVNKGHWTIAAMFAEQLDAEVTLVPTPLAPENTADDVS